ncbi:RAB6-interacting golgin-like [Nematostella vectensis]|uniref:RAB6-interacting golgin-like n=1 Tax=Nematostella vectensis TaxID=45351 RepID=UPI00207759D1|nr:RAB6-interacting golgin-like [Nematostella vectensis]
MSSWAGFTEDEIRRMRIDHGETESMGKQNGEFPLKKSSLKVVTKKSRVREKIRKSEKKIIKESVESVENDKDQVNDESVREIPRENPAPESERSLSPPDSKIQEEKPSSVELEEQKQMDAEPGMITEPERIQAIELSSLEKLQQKQKEIEDENKKKKAALQETLKLRYRKTQAEAKTLQLVQNELSHLDTLLSADVAILRDKIEEAARDFAQAQKCYERAEKEFVESKLDLHRKTERKEMLTEHLYAIIQENEQRKAKKLEELMAKLNVPEAELLTSECPEKCDGTEKDGLTKPLISLEKITEQQEENKEKDKIVSEPPVRRDWELSIETERQQTSPSDC